MTACKSFSRQTLSICPDKTPQALWYSWSYCSSLNVDLFDDVQIHFHLLRFPLWFLRCVWVHPLSRFSSLTNAEMIACIYWKPSFPPPCVLFPLPLAATQPSAWQISAASTLGKMFPKLLRFFCKHTFADCGWGASILTSSVHSACFQNTSGFCRCAIVDIRHRILGRRWGQGFLLQTYRAHVAARPLLTFLLLPARVQPLKLGFEGETFRSAATFHEILHCRNASPSSWGTSCHFQTTPADITSWSRSNRDCSHPSNLKISILFYS